MNYNDALLKDGWSLEHEMKDGGKWYNHPTKGDITIEPEGRWEWTRPNGSGSRGFNPKDLEKTLSKVEDYNRLNLPTQGFPPRLQISIGEPVGGHDMRKRERLRMFGRKKKKPESTGIAAGGYGKPVHAFSGTINYIPKRNESMKNEKTYGQHGGEFQDTADEVVTMLNRNKLAMNLGFNRIYSSHTNGIHFDFAGGGFSITLDNPNEWELTSQEKDAKVVLDLSISGESSKEVTGVMDQELHGKTFPMLISKIIVDTILDAAIKAREAYEMEHPEEYPEEDMSKAMNIFKSLCEDEVGKKYTMSKTFEVITPESAEAGDAEERGFEYEDREFDTLWDMAQEIRNEGATEDSGSWFNTIDPDRDYKTGEETYYSFHPSDNVDYAELAKLVKMDNKQFNAAELKYYPEEPELEPEVEPEIEDPNQLKLFK
jgi:hypothetical protein